MRPSGPVTGFGSYPSVTSRRGSRLEYPKGSLFIYLPMLPVSVLSLEPSLRIMIAIVEVERVQTLSL